MGSGSSLPPAAGPGRRHLDHGSHHQDRRREDPRVRTRASVRRVRPVVRAPAGSAARCGRPRDPAGGRAPRSARPRRLRDRWARTRRGTGGVGTRRLPDRAPARRAHIRTAVRAAMKYRSAAVVGAGVGIAGAAALAVHSAPSLVALSWLGRHVSPGLAGVGVPGHVALTFDDGPDPASTPAFLAALDALDWHATFFMPGSMVRRAPGLAAEVAVAGHEVAVHGDRHRNMLRRTPRAVADDVSRARDTIAGATGAEPAWF